MELKHTFDTVASSYEKIRPGYVQALFNALLAYCPVNENSTVCEVGSGGGQATLPILKTGCNFTAVECGENFVQLLKEKFSAYKKFSCVNKKFEDCDFKENSFDLVYSATAFHWVPEEAGYKKAFAMLKKGGAFARFRNHPFVDKSNSALSSAIEEIYGRYYKNDLAAKGKSSCGWTEEQARALAMLAEKYGFTDTCYKLFYRERILSAAEYVALLGTYSDCIALEANTRAEFLKCIQQAIESHGGSITIHDTMDLQLARKPV